MLSEDNLNDSKFESKESSEVREPVLLKAEDITEKIIGEMIHVEATSYDGLSVEISDQEIGSILKNPRSKHLVLKNSEDVVVGFLTSLPHDESIEFTNKKIDSLMESKKDAFYIESMAILPKYRGYRNFVMLLKKIFSEVQNAGYSKIAMHARVSTRLSDILQKKFGAKFFHRVDNFMGTTESFDYLVIDFNDSVKKGN